MLHHPLPIPPRETAHSRLDLVTARDLMRPQMITIDRHASLAEAGRLLVGNSISGAPVTDASGHVVGVISLRDLVERYAEEPAVRPWPAHVDQPALGEGDDEEIEQDLEEELAVRSTTVAEEDRVEDVMTSEIRSVPASASLPQIAEAMKRHSVHRLLVEENGRYVGLIGTLEVLDVLFP
jgi:CBS domain-containing protein